MATDAVLSDFLVRERRNLRGLEEELNFSTRGENEIPERSEEPECIKRWAVAFHQRIEVKDDAERRNMSQLEEQGLKDLHEWALQYRDSLSRGRKLSRAHDKELRDAQEKAVQASAMISGADAGQAVLWDRVCQLCNFVTSTNEDAASAHTTSINSKDNQRDMNRMRVLLLQLKKNPPSVQSNTRYH
ncbi:unnamed protein product [Heterobilharzia americana]|nr:unnamed protein product [Heterobilharzia americana]